MEEALRRELEAPPLPPKLKHSLRYATLDGGKRFRPLLYLATAESFGLSAPPLEPALAVELFHTFTLLQDDLPALDNADTRRGRPTTHRKFGEATALLASDALLCLGYDLLARAPLPRAVRLEAIQRATVRLTLPGVIGGQQEDLEAGWRRGEGSLEEVLRINRRKTGALMALAMELGALTAGTAPEQVAEIGEEIGMLFQVADDLEDEEDRRLLEALPEGLNALQEWAEGAYQRVLNNLKEQPLLQAMVAWGYRRKLPEVEV